MARPYFFFLAAFAAREALGAYVVQSIAPSCDEPAMYARSELQDTCMWTGGGAEYSQWTCNATHAKNSQFDISCKFNSWGDSYYLLGCVDGRTTLCDTDLATAAKSMKQPFIEVDSRSNNTGKCKGEITSRLSVVPGSVCSPSALKSPRYRRSESTTVTDSKVTIKQFNGDDCQGKAIRSTEARLNFCKVVNASIGPQQPTYLSTILVHETS